MTYRLVIVRALGYLHLLANCSGARLFLTVTFVNLHYVVLRCSRQTVPPSLRFRPWIRQDAAAKPKRYRLSASSLTYCGLM